jgi:hypothetical protein
MLDGWEEKAGGDFIHIRRSRFRVVEVSETSAAASDNETRPARVRGDLRIYLLAGACGIAIGMADIAVDDLLFTALLVLAACMLLGLLRSRSPWRWIIAVVIFVPLTQFAAYSVVGFKPSRAQIYGSFLAALPGLAGAYGGAVMRRVFDNLRERK